MSNDFIVTHNLDTKVNIDITEPEIRLILDMLGRMPVQGLETMQAILSLSVKLEAAIPGSSGEPV